MILFVKYLEYIFDTTLKKYLVQR